MAPLIHLLFRAFSLLPLPVLHALGWVLGWASFLLSSRYRRRLLAHAKQAGYSTGVALRSVGEAGKLVAEAAKAEGLKVTSTGDGVVEAVAETFWFGFKDDVVFRIRPAATGAG